MSIRVILCTLYIIYFAIRARRDWFTSLCATIVLMAFFQHPDMPKSIAGIQGMNLWNLLMFFVMLGWWRERRAEGRTWDAPKTIKFFFCTYFGIVTLSVTRLLMSPGDWPGEVHPSAMWMISEYFINCYKWILPGLLLFDACRTRARLLRGAFSVMLLYLLLALQIAKHVPPSYVNSDSFNYVAYKLVQESVGYNRVTLSMMLGGASWAVLALLPLAETRWRRIGVLSCFLAIAYGQALTGGRSGYIGWLAVGLVLCILKWRRLLLLIPVMVALVFIFLPGVKERLLQGVGAGAGGANNTYEMTSGRNIAWPYVIARIEKQPIFGFGREGMIVSGTYQQILDDTHNEESFPHPHNAYLEALLDSGIIGFVAIVPFYLLILRCSVRLFMDKENALCSAVGGMALALVLALVVAALGGETFYPREGAVGMWAAIGLAVRAYADRGSGAGAFELPDEPDTEASEELQAEAAPV